MGSTTFEKLKELNLSRDEVERIGDAFKKPEFRKLLVEYVEELQDPENKKLYEQEIIELEKERGVEVTFIHPQPGYVIKTSVNGNQKAFINVCSNELVKKPTSSPTVKEGARGLNWSLPHSLSPPREDLDNKQIRCQVYDIVFHPDTLHLAERNKAFRAMVNNTALDAVETNFDVKVDKKNLKFPKLSYKGIANPSVIRKHTADIPQRSAEEKELYDKIFAKAEAGVKQSPKRQSPKRADSIEDLSEYTTPKYIIKHRTHLDIQEFTTHKDSKLNAAIPKELLLEVNLPLLKAASDITLDVTQKTVQVISDKPAKYKLNLTLPYQVNETAGNAKFEKDLKKLIVTLPVHRSSSFSDFSDSGVDSDNASPGSPDSEEEVQNKPVDEPSEQCFNKSTEFRTNFLDEAIHYTLPDFTCHLFENTIAFTLNVKNVHENSVSKLFRGNNEIHVKFTSISSSFYPSHYAFYVRLPDHTLDENDVCVEVWDNNVVLQVPVNCDREDKPLRHYFYGLDADKVAQKYVEEPDIINQVLDEDHDENKVVPQNDFKSAMISKPQQTQEAAISDPECVTTQPQEIQNQSTKAIDIIGTSYESSGDELSCNSYSPRKGKGILKRMPAMKRFAVGRSISESSLDDLMFSSSFENYNISLDSEIPEEDAESSTSLKKTVRFSDVIMKQMFRSNSSILGQKKKNQRKAQKKKRALERRHSESEASEVEEKKEGESKDLNEKADKTAKKEDHDIFHLDIDN